MQLSRESKIVSGFLLIAVPTIMYGGVTLLGILTEGVAGLRPGGLALNETQWSLWRAGHAHAGVFVLLSLVLQPLIDNSALSKSLEWIARLGAPIASVLMPAGLFGLAFLAGFKWLIYIGALCLVASLLITGIGLLKNIRQER